MLSLSNTYTNQDLEEYDKRIKKNLNVKNIEYACELKYDGVALSILYENGKGNDIIFLNKNLKDLCKS